VTSRVIVTAPVWLWGEGKGSWHFLTVSPEEAVKLRLAAVATGLRRGFGLIRVEASIKGVAWRTSIFPQKEGGYLLPIKAAVRREAEIAAWDEVRVTIDPE